jgi:hypothetical protein
MLRVWLTERKAAQKGTVGKLEHKGIGQTGDVEMNEPKD